MSRKKRNHLAMAALVATLAFGSITPLYGTGGGVNAASASLGSINISGSSYFELKEVNILPDQSGKLATFTVTVHNKGNSELLFIDYWVRLKSKSGNQFTAKLLPEDKDKNRIAPGASTDITFYANVNESTNLQDLVVQFIKWDFSQPNFERVLGQVEVPDTYTNVTPVDGSQIIAVSGSEIQASVNKLISNKNEKYYVPTAYFNLENVGNRSVTIPTYLFAIRTSEGLLYPLEAKGLKDLAINPKEKKEIQLSGSIPVSVSPEGWQLVITESVTVAEAKMNLPVATFQLPATSQQEGGTIGKEYSFTSEAGIYYSKMNGLYRLPWEDQDILTADLTLMNKGTDSLPIPKLAGYFLLDDAVKVPAKLIKTAKVIALGAGTEVKLQVAGMIPYTYEFSQVKLVLQEQEGEGSSAVTTEVLEFSSQAELQAIPLQGKSESYTMSETGRRAAFKVLSTTTYSSNTGSVYTAQLEATNMEKRFANIAKLVAHFRAEDGTVFPASIAEVKTKLNPSGKALLNVYATLPTGYTLDNMHLLIGEAITEGAVTEGDKVADSYIKPVGFVLPKEDMTVKDKLMELKLFPYTVNINRIGTTIEGSKLTLLFNYEITKDTSTVTNLEDRKLVVVFEDSDGIKGFEKAFKLSDFDPKAGEEVTDKTLDMKLGKREKFIIPVDDADLIYKQQFLKKYSLSIYEEFQGQRKLLGKQSNDWFIFSD